MRLGAPIHAENPDQWIAEIQAAGYRAAYCPVNADADTATIRAYQTAAANADIIIAEVGAWSNPLSPNAAERSAALEKCQRQLALADEIGAWCCVNIAGSRGEHWDGPHPDNLTPATFDLIVESVRTIIDAVQPKRTFYTLETMPWMYPDSVDSYVDLIAAIDRPQFAVHLDPVNMVNSVERYFRNGALIRDFFERLGAHIKSIHAKDIVIGKKLTVHLDEVRPGLGGLDYAELLRQAARLHPDLPLMLEHLPMEEYPPSAQYVRSVASELNLSL